MRKIQLLLLLLISSGVFSATPKLSRNYAYRHFTTRDGLAQMQVMCAYQDNDGYLWFGTKGGVSRWDGTSFKNYTPEDGLPYGETRYISEWGTRKLIFTYRQMIILDENDSITVYDLPEKMLYPGFFQLTLAVDDTNIFILGLVHEKNENESSPRYNFSFNIHEKKFKPITSFNKKVRSVKGNNIICSNGVYIWTKNKFIKKLDFPFEAYYAIFNNSYTKCALQKIDTNKYELFKKEKNTFVQIGKTEVYESAHRCIWLPDGSFLSINTQGHLFYPTRSVKLYDKFAFPNFSFVDKENNLWIGTENGLYNFFNLNIEEYTFNLGNPDNIWSVIQDNTGKMWLGSFGNGLITLDAEQKIKVIDFKNKIVKKKRLAANQIYMGSTTHKEIVYIATALGAAMFKESKISAFTNTPGCLYTYFDTQTNKLMYSGMDTITGHRGLYIGIDANKKFYPFEKGFPICVIRDGKNKIRVGAFRGSGWLENNKLIVDTTKREYVGIVSMDIDNQKRLWKATEKGIYVELLNGKEFRISAKQLTGAFTSLIVYKSKYIVVGGTHGFAIVDIRKNTNYENLTVINIGYDAGFTGLESGQNGICVDSQGFVWLATALNVLRFNPEEIVKAHTHFLPTIRINSISFSNDNTNWNSHYFSNGKATISSDNKFLRIEFIANSISSPKSLRFRYRLLGLSDKWSDPVSNKAVNYTNIDFGKYQFEVQCSLNGEEWSNIKESPLIEITAPFYMRPWSIFAIVMLLIIISIISTRMIVKRNNQRKLEKINRQKLENELQLNTLRTKIIPHFTKNVLSAIGHFAMTDKLKAGHYISVFSKFNGLTLANADKNYNSIKNEIEYIQVYLELEKMRFGDRFNYQITVNKNIDRNTLIPTMILHTYCDNAIRHGLVNKKETGILKIEIAQSNQGILITITDNGIGRKKAKEIGTQGEGQGLRLIDNQLEFYNQKNKHKIIQTITDLQNENGKALGTKIELHIPTMYSFE